MSAQIWTPLDMPLSSNKLYIYVVSYLKFLHISNVFFHLKYQAKCNNYKEKSEYLQQIKYQLKSINIFNIKFFVFTWNFITFIKNIFEWRITDFILQLTFFKKYYKFWRILKVSQLFYEIVMNFYIVSRNII